MLKSRCLWHGQRRRCVLPPLLRLHLRNDACVPRTQILLFLFYRGGNRYGEVSNLVLTTKLSIEMSGISIYLYLILRLMDQAWLKVSNRALCYKPKWIKECLNYFCTSSQGNNWFYGVERSRPAALIRATYVGIIWAAYNTWTPRPHPWPTEPKLWDGI